MTYRALYLVWVAREWRPAGREGTERKNWGRTEQRAVAREQD